MKIENKLVDDIYVETIKERAKHKEGSIEWDYFTGVLGVLKELQSLDKELDLSNNNDSLKDYTLSAIDDLEEHGHNLEDNCYIYQWRYSERPDVLVTLVLGDFEYIEDDKGDLH